jgi:hypothetical protein
MTWPEPLPPSVPAWPRLSSPPVDDSAERVFRVSDRIDKARAWTVQLLILFPALLLVGSALGQLWQWLVRAWTGKQVAVPADPGPVWARLLWLLAVCAAVVAVLSLIRRPVPRRWPWRGARPGGERLLASAWRQAARTQWACDSVGWPRRASHCRWTIAVACRAAAVGSSCWPVGGSRGAATLEETPAAGGPA